MAFLFCKKYKTLIKSSTSLLQQRDNKDVKNNKGETKVTISNDGE